MNAEQGNESTSQIMGILAIMGFAAEGNLRDVANALGQRDVKGLSQVDEKNAKQPRLRAEIEERIASTLSQLTDERQKLKLSFVSRMAALFERMGLQTVEIAKIARQILQQPKPGRTADLKKLIEHAVYITDRASTGLLEDDLELAKMAQVEFKSAKQLYSRLEDELSPSRGSLLDIDAGLNLLRLVIVKAKNMIEEAGILADDVVTYLDRADLN